MAYLLIGFPLLLAGLAFAMPSNRWRPWLLPVGGLGQLALAYHAIFLSEPGSVTELGGWLLLDALGKVVLGFIVVLFFLCSLYAPGYLALRSDRPNRFFCANLFAMLAMMSLVTLSHHLGLMWVAMEATTLVSAPCLYFNRNPRCLEATWKFLLICSVGIALALFGSFFLAYSARVQLDEAGRAGSVSDRSTPVADAPGSPTSSLLFDDLIKNADNLSPPWLRAAFVLLFVGYGTKLGLAPMHTWKPDAYGEAPGIVGTLLAGGVTSCAFLAILRVYQICRDGPVAEFARSVMIVMGLFSVIVAAIFMVRQRDFKRLLAYSSVENVGVLVLGIGIGGSALFGALLHMINNGLTKGILFLSAGNIHRAYGSKFTDNVHGAIHRVPLSATLFLIGFLAISGSPPFGPFVSEFTIVAAMFEAQHHVAAAVLLSALAVAFVGMGATVLAVVQGEPGPDKETRRQGDRETYRDSWTTVGPILLLLALVLMLGVYMPPPLESLLREAAQSLEARP